MGAIILNEAEIGEYALVGAGALLTERTRIPALTPALGSPAKPVRELTERDLARIRAAAAYGQGIRIFVDVIAGCHPDTGGKEVWWMEKMSMIYEALLSLHADMVLDESIRSFKEKWLYEQIDLALQRGDERQFLELTEQLKALAPKSGG